jgi:hypothetical protein
MIVEEKCDMPSPFVEGGKCLLCTEEREYDFRGEKIKVPAKYYRCVETGHKFTTSEMDEDTLWAVFRKYCTNHFDSFSEIWPEFKKR